MGDTVIGVRLIFIAMPIFLGLVLMSLPSQTGAAVASGVVDSKSASVSPSHHATDRNNASRHEHGGTEYDDCHATASSCAAATPGIATDGVELGERVSKTLRLGYAGVFRIGLRPLPLVPPPEHN